MFTIFKDRDYENVFMTAETFDEVLSLFDEKDRIWVEAYRQVNYSVLSACGLILTAIVFPVVTVVKKLLEKYGPRVD